MATRARDQLAGTIVSVSLGVMAEVVVDVGGQQVVWRRSRRVSAERLGLAEGGQVTAIIKATDVMIGTD